MFEEALKNNWNTIKLFQIKIVYNLIIVSLQFMLIHFLNCSKMVFNLNKWQLQKDYPRSVFSALRQKNSDKFNTVIIVLFFKIKYHSFYTDCVVLHPHFFTIPSSKTNIVTNVSTIMAFIMVCCKIRGHSLTMLGNQRQGAAFITSS